MKTLLVVSQAGFQPVEYSDTRKALEEEGIDVEVASFAAAEAIGADGSKVNIDVAINAVDVADYDAVVLIGGGGAVKEFDNNPDVIKLVQDFDNSHKIVAAICFSPVVLAQARLLKDRRATVWNEADGWEEEQLGIGGATYVKEAVVVDTRFVTANGPMAAKEFGKAIAKVLKEGVDKASQ
jgi:protease I